MTIQVPSTRDSLAQTYVQQCTHASLHVSAPGTTGAGEATGGSPAYARKPITWTKSSDGVYVSDPIDFDVPAGSYGWVGLWSALTGGTFRDFDAFGSTLTATAQDVVTITITYTQD